MVGDILIDVDGVLADPHTILVNDYQRRGVPVRRTDITDWDFGNFRIIASQVLGYEITPKMLLDEYHNIWETRYEEIPLLDKEIPAIIQACHRRYPLDIVTANPVPNVPRWLEMHGFPTKRFSVYSGHKADLGHKVFVDDYINPPVQDPQVHAKPVQPWNTNVISHVCMKTLSELPSVLVHYERMGLLKRK